MNISRVEIKGICCFDEVKIDFTSKNNEALKVATILGDNGTGKTTLMRCIAMGLCDKSSSVGLIQELYGNWINDKKDEGIIRIEFVPIKNKKNNNPPYVERTFKKTSSGNIEIANEQINPDPFPWDDVFACGYGAARGTFGTKDYGEYATVDSVYTLFNYDSKLQNAELIIRRIKDIDLYQTSDRSKDKLDAKVLLKKILNWIDRILDLPEESTQLGKSGITVSGPWGKFMPYMSLGDGYRATIAWISDLLGWALFYDETMFNGEISGIVLLDEIEQHLHPSWQRKIIRLLTQQFPMIQFIFTTHSPLVAANATKLTDTDISSKLFHLNFEGEYSRLTEVEERLGDLNLDQILSSEAFDYIFDINPSINSVLKEASILAAKDQRTTEEEFKLTKFKEALKEIMFPKGRSLIERIVERDYYKELENNIHALNNILRNSHD